MNLRGHPIEWVNREWVYCDTKQPTQDTWQGRPCGYCGLHNTKEGHDGCIGTLPNAMNACCGHGSTNEAYVQFINGSIIRGNNAIKYMEGSE